MKVPSPLNGWRIFWGEVGIIVIGVLLALGAQQLVEAISWRGQVRDFRLAVDKELGENLSIYQIRLRQNDCVSRRLAEVERLLVIPDGQTPMRLRRISEVDNYTFYFSVWDNKDAAVTAHLPVDIRSRYGQIYDEFRNADHQRASENDTWRSINQFNLPEPLTHADRLRLSELLSYARQIDSNRRYNWDAAVVGMAKGLNLRPQPLPFKVEGDPDFCQPFLAPDNDHREKKPGQLLGQ